jgi:DNA-binding response OmpR family regulator
VESTIRPMVDKKSQGLEIEVDGGLPPLTADIFRVKQVLLNLLSNAHKFTPKRGSILLSCRRVDPTAMLFSVADTGIGIKLEDQEIIFEEFRQARKKKPDEEITGTGLGLAISRRLVEMHGGSLWVESEYGSGATFHFLLPIAGPPENATEEQDVQLEAPERKGAIVVEQDRLLCNLLTLHLRQAGYTPFPRYGEAGVLTSARELLPEFIALDVTLVAQDGWRVLSALKSHPATKAIPILAMCSREANLSGYSLGTADLLPKPLRLDDLRNLMQRLVPDGGGERRMKVLLVDDDPATAASLREGGVPAYCTLLTTGEIDEALRLAQSEQPDAILLDPAVGDLAGLDLIQRLRGGANTGSIPVVGLAAAEQMPKQLAAFSKRLRALAEQSAVEASSLAAELIRLGEMSSAGAQEASAGA